MKGKGLDRSADEGLDEIGKRFRTDKSSLGHDYLRHYERFFRPFRQDGITLVEIGGKKGASLRMWSEYFPCARIICIDVDPTVGQLRIDRVTAHIGDAGSPSFLASVREKYGTARIVLDDGSHRWDHQRIAFKELFSTVEPGGYYVIEDIHTSHEEGFSGVDDFPFTEFLKKLVDYLNLRRENRLAFEASHNKDFVEIARNIDFICFISRSCVIRRRERPPTAEPIVRSPL